MAEGWAKHLWKNGYHFFSAGIEKQPINPLAVRVMQEAGVDMGQHYSKTIQELPESDFDLVITVCGHANDQCPTFPSETKVIHRGFDDPPKLARDARTEEEALLVYRKVRDEIREFIDRLPSELVKVLLG